MAYDDDDDGGMGLSDFLNHDPDAQKLGGRLGWLQSWKKAKKIDIWLHTGAKIHAVYGHQMPFEDEVDEKNDAGEKTGGTKLILRWPRFLSPDQSNIHANQYFRDDRGIMKEQENRNRKGKPIGYMRDPFLVLREYLRHAGNAELLNLDDVVFEWVNRKERGELIQWRVGELSGLEKRGKKNRGHSLDTKLEYIFIVVQNDKPGDGPLIARETKLVGDLMRSCIQQQIESRGTDEGNPFTYPYCFRWEFDANSKSPMTSYKVFRIDKAECTDEIWKQIGGDVEGEEPVEPPDITSLTTVQEGDMEKIRTSMEAAAQFDLPFDLIFSEDEDDRRSLVTGTFLNNSKATRSKRTEQAAKPGPAKEEETESKSGGATRPASRKPAAKPGPARTEAKTEVEEKATTSAPSRRRKTKTEPKPEPEVEKFACEGPDDDTPCGELIPVTCEVCPKCGAEYEIEAEPEQKPKTETKKVDASKPGKSGVTRPGSSKSGDDSDCIACGSADIETTVEDGVTTRRCNNCGADQGDDLPF